MNVNSKAFKNKCQFIASLRYELFFSLSAAASKWPNNPHGLKQWSVHVSEFFKGLNPTIRVGLEHSSVVASFFPVNDTSQTPEQMFRYLEKLDNQTFLYLFLEGFLHDKDICKSLVEGKLTLKVAINRIGQKKREWLSYLRLYPVDSSEHIIQFFEWFLSERAEAQIYFCKLYREWWEKVFSKFWEAKKGALKTTAKNYDLFFSNSEFEDFASKALLKIRLGTKGNTIEAMRGGYKIDCADIDHIYFIPSVFNNDRLWSAIERPSEDSVIYFPFLDLDLLQQLGEIAPSSKIDPALMCRAVGDPTRYALLSMLSREPQPAVVLAQKLDLTRATVSHHVSVLKEAGILSDDGSGRQLQINWDAMSNISNLLVESLKHKKNK